MTDLMLYLFLGFCAVFIVIYLVTGAEWCQRLMLKKYFPQTVEILKHYQSIYEMWQLIVQRLDKVDKDIKWGTTDRIKYYLITNNQEELEKLNELYLERKQLIEREKKVKELLKQDKFLIEAQAPFILFNDIRPYQIYKRQEFNIFDVMWVHRKQKKFEKIVKKHLTYLENYDIM